MRRHVASLDGLRAVAVGLVVAAHSGDLVVPFGAVGVDVFFVLSGFLITGILAEEQDRTGTLRLGRFYARRALRLTPALLLCVALFVGYSLLRDGTAPWGVVAVALTYTANYARAVYDYHLVCLGPFWSLASEEQFYLVWPWVVLALAKITPARHMRARLLAFAAFALAAYRFLMEGTFSDDRLYYALDTHMDGLVLGGALAYWLPSLEASLLRRPDLARRWSYGLVPAALAVLALVVQRKQWILIDSSQYGFALTALASAVVIADLVASPASWLRGLLEHRVLVYFGTISYGLYLYHSLVFHMARLEIGHHGPVLRVAVSLVGSFLVAVLSYELVERRVLKLKSRFE